jgi:hypothetical protein
MIASTEHLIREYEYYKAKEQNRRKVLRENGFVYPHTELPNCIGHATSAGIHYCKCDECQRKLGHI